MATIGVVASAAGGVEQLREGLVQPLIERGHVVALTVTPTAGGWLDRTGERTKLAELTGLPVRSEPRFPDEDTPHPQIDLYVAAPWTASSTAKLSLGIADNQALTALCESIATVPVIVFPRVNAAHARQPAWPDHIARLRAAGVQLIYGDDVWPLAEPRAAGPRVLPWPAIISAVETLEAGRS
ncbi:flavoprotein [Nakamurella aerolata]|nr:flavoprotein [Nakamurella aerolata]